MRCRAVVAAKKKVVKWISRRCAIDRMAAPPNTTLDVSMTETVKLNAQGLAIGKPIYVVHEVHGATPPPTQTGFSF